METLSSLRAPEAAPTIAVVISRPLHTAETQPPILTNTPELMAQRRDLQDAVKAHDKAPLDPYVQADLLSGHASERLAYTAERRRLQEKLRANSRQLVGNMAMRGAMWSKTA